MAGSGAIRFSCRGVRLEMHMHADVYNGRRRAVSDAILYSSLGFFRMHGQTVSCAGCQSFCVKAITMTFQVTLAGTLP
jgi:hypothetical protein